MHPIFFNLGPLPISSFGVFFAIGFVLGVFSIFRSVHEDIVMLRANILEETIFDIIIMTSLSGWLGARISYILIHFKDFGLDPLKWLLFTYFPGLHLLGAILGALLFLFLFTKVRKYPLLPILDHATFGFLVASPFGFVGSFLGERVSQFPIQAVLAVIMLVLYFVFYYARQKRVIRRDGIVFLTFLLVFAIVSFGFEFTRLDKTYITFLTFRQILSIILFAIASSLFVNMYRKNIIIFFRKRNLIW